MKCAGAFLLLGACLLCGIRAAKQLDRNAAQIRLLRQLVTDLMNELRYTLAPVGQLLQTLAGHAAYRELAFLQNAAANADAFPQSWQAAVQSDRQLMPEAAAVDTYSPARPRNVPSNCCMLSVCFCYQSSCSPLISAPHRSQKFLFSIQCS